MRRDSGGVGGVHLLMVVAGPAMVAAFQRRMEETIAICLRVDVTGGRAAVDAALIPPLLQRAGPRACAAALSAHVHDRRTDLTHHASLLYTRTISPLPYPHFQESVSYLDARTQVDCIQAQS